MKTTIKTGFLAMSLLLAMSCKKENNYFKSLPITDKSSMEALSTNIDAVAAAGSITIGTQRWKTRNLNVSRYRNGDPIPQVTDAAAWSTLTTGAWCYADNNPLNGNTYGKLYNWYAVNDPRGLAPVGWHVPSDVEWNILSSFLGGEAVAGGKMKEINTTHWLAPNVDATDSSGFRGLPGGYRLTTGSFIINGINGDWWSSSDYTSGDAWYRNLYNGNGTIYRSASFKRLGFSVRCLKN